MSVEHVSYNSLCLYVVDWIWLSTTSVPLVITHTHPFNCPLSGTTQVSRYQKGRTNLDFTEARDSEWQWNPLGHMQVCTSLQTDNHASSHSSVFLQAGCPSCRPTNSVKALKATLGIIMPLGITITIIIMNILLIEWGCLPTHCPSPIYDRQSTEENTKH